MNKVKSLLLSALFLCGITAASGQSIEEAGAKFEEARELAKVNKLDEAVPALEKAIEMADAVTDNENSIALSEAAKKLLTQIYIKLGANEIKEKNFDGAIAKFSKAEELATMYGIGDLRRQAARFGSSAYLAKGIDMFNSKNYAEALDVFKKGYEQDNKNVKLALFTAQAYAETGDLVNAAELFKQVIETGTANSKYAEEAKDAKQYLSTYFLVSAQEDAVANNLDKVIETVDKVLAIDPSNAMAQLMPIQVANNLKKYDVVISRGVAALQQSLDEETASNINLLLGVAYQNMENKAKALEALGKVTGEKAADAKVLIADINK